MRTTNCENCGIEIDYSSGQTPSHCELKECTADKMEKRKIDSKRRRDKAKKINPKNMTFARMIPKVKKVSGGEYFKHVQRDEQKDWQAWKPSYK